MLTLLVKKLTHTKTILCELRFSSEFGPAFVSIAFCCVATFTATFTMNAAFAESNRDRKATAAPLAANSKLALKDFKHSIQELTGSKQTFSTKFGNNMNVYYLPAAVTNKKQENLRFLIQGGLHGNELLASEFVQWLAERIAHNESPLNQLNGGRVEFDIVPYANPDGSVLYARYNANRINLNRNFGVLWGLTKENPGPSPFSEIETQGVRALFETRRYTSAVDVHGFVNWIVAPTPPNKGHKGLPDLSIKDVERYQKWTQEIQSNMRQLLPGYEYKTAGELGDGGAFEDYAWWGQKVLSYCLEMRSESRYEIYEFASKFLSSLTPKALLSQKSLLGPTKTDMFLVYEKFIASMFQKAADLNQDTSIKTAAK